MLLKKIIIFCLCYCFYCTFSLAENTLQKCVLIKQIILQQATILTNNNQFILDAKNQCFNKQNINQLLTNINNFYNEKGYILVNSNFTFFDYNKNILYIKINETIISDILFDKTINQQHYIFFKHFINKICNIFELNSALQQLNKIHKLDIKIKIINQKNNLKIYLYQPKKQSVKLNIGYDNFGNNFTGLNRYKLDFNLYEHFNFNYTYNTKHFHSLFVDSNIKWQNNYIYHQYLSSFFNQKQQNIKFTGQSYRHNFGINSLVFFNKTHQINLDNTLILRGSANYLDHIKLEINRQKLAIGQIAIINNWNLDNNFSLKIKPSFLFGLSSFGAIKDRYQNLPKNQFRLFKLDIETSYPLHFLSAMMLHKLESQKSLHKLFGAEQITVGGYNSVSAFRENIINGDNGYVLQNKISFNAKQILPKLPKNNLEFEIFHDYGYASHNKPSNIKSGRISDIGLKINFVEKKFTASLTSSYAIHQSNMFDYNKSENYNLYFNIGIFLF